MLEWVLFISAGLLVSTAAYLFLKNISEELDEGYVKQKRPVRSRESLEQRRPARSGGQAVRRCPAQSDGYMGQGRPAHSGGQAVQRRPAQSDGYMGQERLARSGGQAVQRRPAQSDGYMGQGRPVRSGGQAVQRRPVQGAYAEPAVRRGGGQTLGGRRRGTDRRKVIRLLRRVCMLVVAAGLTYYFVNRSVEAGSGHGGADGGGDVSWDVGGATNGPDISAQKVNAAPSTIMKESIDIAVETVLRDKEPPVIKGVQEVTMTVGASVSYKKGITVTDNIDQDVKLDVDLCGADISVPGDYTIIYSATDRAGNKAAVLSILHVLPLTLETATEETIYAEADKVLADILTESMSQYEQAEAIYNWCHNKIAYSDGTPKTNWVEGAYRGLIDRKGDCYVYYATAKCLLTRAGITNMDIEKIPAKSMHYWNLIDIGEGWHHFDTCRRKDGSTFFYKTDAELMEYSKAHNGTHNYDKSLYPEIK